MAPKKRVKPNESTIEYDLKAAPLLWVELFASDAVVVLEPVRVEAVLVAVVDPVLVLV
jgi:hypothetical protein